MFRNHNLLAEEAVRPSKRHDLQEDAPPGKTGSVSP
jgi:hypothetical protein